MKALFDHLRSYAIWLWPYLLFSAIVIWFGPYYYGQIIPDDAVSYISIAEKYAGGRPAAINAYWSPMISILLTLFIKAGINAVIGFHIIKVCCGMLIIFLSRKCIQVFEWQNWAQTGCMAVIAGWAAYFTLHYLSPDALMTALLILYLYWTLTGIDLQKPMATGMLGAALYLTKAFGFYFFLAHVVLRTAWQLIRRKTDMVTSLKRSGTALLMFGLIGLAWMSALQSRYGKWTVSTAGPYNHGLMQYGNGSVQPSLRAGLLPLPDADAYNAWEEITLVYDQPDWNPFDSNEHLALQWKVFTDNSSFILQKLYGANRLAWPAALFGLLLFFKVALRHRAKKEVDDADERDAGIFLFVALYCGGYAMAGVDERYLWIADVGLLFITFSMVDRIIRNWRIPVIVAWGMAAALLAVCTFETIGKLRFFSNEMAIQPRQAIPLLNVIPKGTHVATHRTNTINALSYWGQWHDHGGLEGHADIDAQQAALQRFKVEWVLIPDSVVNRYEWLKEVSDSIVQQEHWSLYRMRR